MCPAEPRLNASDSAEECAAVADPYRVATFEAAAGQQCRGCGHLPTRIVRLRVGGWTGLILCLACQQAIKDAK